MRPQKHYLHYSFSALIETHRVWCEDSACNPGGISPLKQRRKAVVSGVCLCVCLCDRYGISVVCALRVCCVCVACGLCVRCVCVACALHVRCLLIVCAHVNRLEHAHCLHEPRVLSCRVSAWSLFLTREESVRKVVLSKNR